MCIEWLKKKICTPECDIDPPSPKEDMNHSEVYTILRAELGDECKIYLSDVDYKTTTKEEIQRFLANDDTNLYNYIGEYYDCDDFSFRLHGKLSVPGWGDLTFGIFWVGMPGGGGHAVNIFIDSDSKVWCVEPQTDDIYELPKEWVPWLVVM